MNSMYSVPRVARRELPVLPQHGRLRDPAVLSDQPIAHRMWQMVDDINHQYLPPNIKAVTCYTCHQGAKWPNALVTGRPDETPVEAELPLHPEVHANPGAHLDAGVLIRMDLFLESSATSVGLG